jgi:sec-independent protein translocase protein TatC
MVENDLPLLTLEEHLKDLKSRVLKSLVVFCLAITLAFIFSDFLYDFLAHPLLEAISSQASNMERKLIFTGITEAFMTHMKLSIFIGFIISFPYFAIQFYAFIAPGLYQKEKKVLFPFILASLTLFFLGIFIAYYCVAPLACKFFLTFENTLHFKNSSFPVLLEARVSEYLNSIIQLTVSFGLVFQLPIVLLTLAKLGLITLEKLISYRRQAIVLNFIIAAIITPPDVFSQISLALPMVILYELSIFLIKKF